MNKRLATVGVVAACAACCAPLILPLLSGAGLVGAGLIGGGVLLGVPLDAWICGGIALAVVAGIFLWARHRRRAQAAPACGCQTACSTKA
jgi:hypothetical protein